MTTLERAQRLRIIFRVGPPIKYISHLDMMRAWERALRRARVRLAYSQGFNPRPRLVFAAALPVGFTAHAEALDILLEEPTDLQSFAAAVKAQLPAGLELDSVSEVPSALPSLPSQLVAAEYRVVVETDTPDSGLKERLDQLLSRVTIPRVRQRPRGAKEYDLRPLIHKLWLHESQTDRKVIGMLLQADSRATGRPEEVMSALDMAQAVRAIERVRLLFASP
jgi:radical SAM-linked protein